MKHERPRRPVAPGAKTASPSYPTVRQEGVTRRSFLGAALAGGTALVVDTVSVDPAEARGRLRGKRRVVRHPFSVPLPKPYTCPKSRAVVTGVSGRTSDRDLASFLGKVTNRRALGRIVYRALRAHRRERLSDGRVRARAVERIRRDFLALYKARTGRIGYSLRLTLRWRPPPSK